MASRLRQVLGIKRIPPRGSLIWRVFTGFYVLFLGLIAVYGLTFTVLVSDMSGLAEFLKKQDISNGDVLRSLGMGFAIVVSGGVGLIAVVMPSYLRRPPAWSSRPLKSRQAKRGAEMESWRNQIIRETYAQVMEQQERGLLCPNCKGQGHREAG